MTQLSPKEQHVYRSFCRLYAMAGCPTQHELAAATGIKRWMVGYYLRRLVKQQKLRRKKYGGHRCWEPIAPSVTLASRISAAIIDCGDGVAVEEAAERHNLTPPVLNILLRLVELSAPAA